MRITVIFLYIKLLYEYSQNPYNICVYTQIYNIHIFVYTQIYNIHIFLYTQIYNIHILYMKYTINV